MDPETVPEAETAPETVAEASPEPAPFADVKEAADTARDALDTIRSLFDQLVPPENVVVVDVFGGEHRLRPFSARAQIVVMRKLEALLKTDVGADSVASGNIRTIVAGIVNAVSNEAAIAAIAEAFTAAHPAAVKGAMKTAASHEAPANDAADLFGIEEMVAGLAPFFLGLLRRLVGLLGETLQPAP